MRDNPEDLFFLGENRSHSTETRTPSEHWETSCRALGHWSLVGVVTVTVNSSLISTSGDTLGQRNKSLT